MVKVKPLETIKANYRAGATVAPSRYKVGVATADWHGPASSDNAEALWAAKVSEAAAVRRRQRSIARIGNEAWRGPASDKGAARIGTGMTAAVDKQATNFSPYRAALESVALPPRTADPMANVDARVKPIVSALVETKKAQVG